MRLSPKVKQQALVTRGCLRCTHATLPACLPPACGRSTRKPTVHCPDSTRVAAPAAVWSVWPCTRIWSCRAPSSLPWWVYCTSTSWHSKRSCGAAAHAACLGPRRPWRSSQRRWLPTRCVVVGVVRLRAYARDTQPPRRACVVSTATPLRVACFLRQVCAWGAVVCAAACVPRRAAGAHKPSVVAHRALLTYPHALPPLPLTGLLQRHPGNWHWVSVRFRASLDPSQLTPSRLWLCRYGIAIDNVHVKAMFLAGVAGAGVFGALTVSGRILVVQTVPAVAGFALVVLGAMGTWPCLVCRHSPARVAPRSEHRALSLVAHTCRRRRQRRRGDHVRLVGGLFVGVRHHGLLHRAA